MKYTPKKRETAIHKILQQKGWKQSDLLRIINEISEKPMDKAQLSKIVNGAHKSYSVATLIKISKALGVGVGKLIDVNQYRHLFKI
jgi:transcriptional regulator with XRE-family HTH domain